jgi:sec-independent protein translocase protein TatB
MFDLSIEKLLILAVVALFVLGPERLPTAATWLARTLRQIKTYATEANEKIRNELGPEFDEVRAPLDDLRSDLAGLRTWRGPRAPLMHHLPDDPITPHRYPPPPPLTAGKRPPFDPDAT